MNRFDSFFAGEETRAYQLFGAHPVEEGVCFTVFAPHVDKVSLISSLSDWQEEYFLEKIDTRGIWSLVLKGIKPIYSYRYRLYQGNKMQEKIDPFAYYFEKRPANASCMYDLSYYSFQHERLSYSENKAISIYELHLNGFYREGLLASYQAMEEKLIPYLLENAYTHVEIMPLSEHPLDASWGYQVSGFYAITSRYGTPYDLMKFIDKCHAYGIGVILDVVLLHFVTDSFALVNYDFSCLYEKEKSVKSEWGTYYFDFSKKEVISFLMSSAFFYLEKYCLDGLRFDAVSHFIYHEGREDKGINEEGISFIKRLNYHLKKEFPNVMLIAEDSSAFSNVTKTVEEGGLGFDFKWDLGWMNDTLKYYSSDFYFRKQLHSLMTFSMFYFYSEKFLLPLSHDEVVHSKKTIIDKMFGSYEQKFSSCRNLMVYMFTHPGKKLNFMGNELAQFREFDESRTLDWLLMDYPIHRQFSLFFKEINECYRKYSSLHCQEYDSSKFHWIDCDNANQSVFSYYRESEDEVMVVILNMKPENYLRYEIGVPYEGVYEEILNSEWLRYGGYSRKQRPRNAKKKSRHCLPYCLEFHLAPLAAILFCGKKVNR